MTIHPNGDDPRCEKATAAVAVPTFEPSDHEQMKIHLRPGLRDFCEGLLEGVAARDRTAMNLYPRIMGAIGATPEININLATTQAFGMPADEVRVIIESHRQSSATSLEQCAQDGMALLLWVIGEEPERRGAILKALGGTDALALAERNGTG